MSRGRRRDTRSSCRPVRRRPVRGWPRTAEVIFTAQQTLDDAVAFYADVKGQLAAFGRDPDTLKIMPGVFPVVGRTESEAKEKFDALQSLIDPAVGRARIGPHRRVRPVRLSARRPDSAAAGDERQQEPAGTDDRARAPRNLTIRELYLRVAGARGHWQLVGTPEQIVDQLEERFVRYGADGYNVMAPTLPGGLDDFIALVLPSAAAGCFATTMRAIRCASIWGCAGRTPRHHRPYRNGCLTSAPQTSIAQ